jgi:hypothetical protein
MIRHLACSFGVPVCCVSAADFGVVRSDGVSIAGAIIDSQTSSFGCACRSIFLSGNTAAEEVGVEEEQEEGSLLTSND